MSKVQNYRYQHVDTFQELEQEMAEKQLEMATLEIRYQLEPRRLMSSLWKKGIQYLINLF